MSAGGNAATSSADQPAEMLEPDASTGPARHGLWVLASLIFLVIPIRELAGPIAGGEPLALIQLVLTMAFVAGFVTLIVRSSAPAPRARAVLFITTAAVAVVQLVIGGPIWLGLPVYISAAAALSLPRRFARPSCAAAAVGTAIAGLVLDAQLGEVVTYTLSALGVGAGLLGYQHVLNLSRRLAASQEQVRELAVAEERLRFARDLHDVLGHSLSMVALKAQVAERFVDRNPDRVRAEVRAIHEISQRAAEDARATVSGYQARRLVTELDAARALLDAADIRAEFPGEFAPLPVQLDATLGWVVREGVTNAYRHAESTAVAVTADIAEDSVVLAIRNDGTPDRAAHAVAGSGLTGIAERVKEIGGSLAWGALPGGQFELRASVPYARHGDGDRRTEAGSDVSPAPGARS